jgi:hypothetical protein
MSPLYSQKASSDTCCVPCNTLKKALIIRQERIYCGTQLGIARDSISTMKEIIFAKDTIILHRDSSIANYKINESNYKKVIKEKDSIIKTYEKEIKRLNAGKIVAYAVGIVSIISGLLLGI